MSTQSTTTTEAFDLASREARGSREARRSTIAARFRLYLVTRDQTVFLEDKFEKQLAEANFKEGVDNFGLIVRLVFGLEDKKYNSRVSLPPKIVPRFLL